MNETKTKFILFFSFDIYKFHSCKILLFVHESMVLTSIKTSYNLLFYNFCMIRWLFWTALVPFYFQIFVPFQILDCKFSWNFCIPFVTSFFSIFFYRTYLIYEKKNTFFFLISPFNIQLNSIILKLGFYWIISDHQRSLVPKSTDGAWKGSSS